MPVLILAIACFAGCFDPTPVPGAACAEGDRCPSGLTCIAGKCLEEGSELCTGQPDGTPCGNPSVADCDGADTCLAGACASNEAATGAVCYDCAGGPGACLACTAGACTDVTCTLAAGAPAARELTSPFVADNGDEGNMFDVVATTTVTITSFETHSSSTGTTEYEIFTRPGTHVGFEGSAAGWTRVGTATFTLSGLNTFSPIPIPVNITIPAGQRQAFYLTNKTLNHRYHNGTAVGDLLVQTPELAVYQGTGNNYGTNGFESTTSPRAWEGKIRYRSGGGKTLGTTITGTVPTSGVMFDIQAKTSIEATLVSAHLAPGTHDVDVYFKRGSREGAEAIMMQWQHAATLTGVVSAGTNMPTSLPLATPIRIAGDSTTAFYIRASGQLRTAAGAGGNAASNTDVTIKTGVTVPSLFGGAGAAANPNIELGYGVCN